MQWVTVTPRLRFMTIHILQCPFKTHHKTFRYVSEMHVIAVEEYYYVTIISWKMDLFSPV